MYISIDHYYLFIFLVSSTIAYRTNLACLRRYQQVTEPLGKTNTFWIAKLAKLTPYWLF